MKELNAPPRLPWIVKIAVAVTFFNSWVIFEETIVDRHGLWRYILFYRVGLFCTWDVLALAIIFPAVLIGVAPLRRAIKRYMRRLCFVRGCHLCR